jgi:aspartate 1-decarboxylase
VLSVHSGSKVENWNLMETTLLNGVAAADLQVGDEIGVKLYKNHNLAELRVIKSGVK